MCMIKKIFTVVTLFLVLSMTTVLAQSSESTINSETSKLCVISNGNKVPCELVDDAEKSILLDGKTIHPVTGETLCSYGNRVVPCNQLDSNGHLKITSHKEYILESILFLYKYRIVIIAVLGISSVIFLLIIVRRKSKNKAIYTTMNLFIIGLTALGLLLSQKTAKADVPVYSGVVCSCATSALQTCMTSPVVDFNWLTIGPGAGATSCNASNAYVTYTWPNTPPQFFYQGIQTVVGDVALGNKQEAKGVQTSMLPSAATIGQDTGIACVRSGGGQNMTLKLTGKLNYTVQGICLIGSCQYYSKESKNYSCY
jgi:hypothetical protein